MRTTPFPLCCGAVNLSDFGGTHVTAGKAAVTPEDKLKADLQQAIDDHGGKSFIIAILNDDQKEQYEAVFKSKGFKLVTSGFNANHYSDCHLFVRSNTRPAGGRRDRFGFNF